MPACEERLSHGEPTFFTPKRVFAMFANNHHDDGHVAAWLPAAPGVQEALIEEVVEAGMEETFERVIESSREGGIEAFIRFYLRPSHREHPERGCPAAVLGTEIGRHSEATRSAFTRKLRRIVSHIASLLPTPNVEVAQAIFATLVGTLQLARAVSDPALSDRLLKAGQDFALLLAKYKP